MYKKIRPAERVENIGEYYFSRKIAQVAEMMANGKDIISLAIGGPDRSPDAKVIERLCEEAKRPDNHSYQNTRSIPQLREAFAKWYKKSYDVDLDPNTEILPLIGSKEGILHISMAFLNSGDKVLIPNPGYPTYTSATKLVGGMPVYYTLKEETGWQPDFEELERLVASGDVKLMWVNYPHMPTGAKARIETLERLVDFGRRHGIVIAHDNPYSFILNDHPQSILSIEGAKDVSIEMNSLSKSHNMAGWRVAMLASNAEFVSWILKVKSNVDSGQFKPVMLAAETALTLGEEWQEELNNTYRRRREIAEQIMTALDCTYDEEQSGLFLWGRIPEQIDRAETLTERLLNEEGIFITPGHIFGSEGERYVRISLCATEEKMQEALKRIKSK